MRGTFVKGLKKAAGVALALSVVMAASPAIQTHAEDVDVSGTSTTRLVTGNFTITDSDLTQMGYGPKVSIPLSIGLSFSASDSRYTGSDTVYAYGIIDADQSVSVTISSTHEKFGKVYNSADEDCTIDPGNGYGVSTSKEEWSKSECYANLSASKAGSAIPNISTLGVYVPKNTFLPTGTGNYKTYVPVVIQLVED